MAGSLISFGGLPLLVGGTSLTTDPRCCCYYYPPPPQDCPPCCVRIDWGEFDEDGNLAAEYSQGEMTIGVLIDMPTKFSRFVCDDEEITVSWGVRSPDPPATGAFIRFGAAWGHASETPAAEKVFARGLVDWVDIESAEFSATLQLSSCFLDAIDFLAYLRIGLDDPQWSIEIDVFRCENLEKCCPIEYECEPCCFEISGLDTAVLYEGQIWFIAENLAGYSLHVRVITEELGVWCPDQSVQIEFDLIPPRWDPDDEYNAVATWGDPWLYDQHSPDIAIDGEIITNRPPSDSGKVDWGTLNDTEYMLTVGAGCGELFCTEYGTSPISIVINGLPGGSIGFAVSFDPCDEDFTDCCCPPDCRCGCYVEIPENFCDDAILGEQAGNLPAGFYMVEIDPEVLEFEMVITSVGGGLEWKADVSKMRITKEGPSRVYASPILVGGKCCPEFSFFMVPVRYTYGEPGDEQDGGTDWVQIGFNESCDPAISVGVFVPLPCDNIGAILTGCRFFEGGAFCPGEFEESVSYNYEISGEITNTKDCPCEDT